MDFIKKIKIFDMFCSNGSTWIDKNFFNSENVIKNDIRSGEIKIFHQTIKIKPDLNINMFERQEIAIKTELVYLDPPHLINGTGIMLKKYTNLPNDFKLSIENMFYNAYQIAPIAILKWNDLEISIKLIQEIGSKYFTFAFGNRNQKNTSSSYFITLIRKDK